MMSSSSSSRSSGSRKRIHITFHHDRMITLVPVIGSRKQEIEDFLKDVWSEFGTVTNTHYDREYAHGVVTYQSNKAAIFALAGLEDPIQVQAAMQEAVGENPVRAAMAKQLFMENAQGMAITAIWAESS